MEAHCRMVPKLTKQHTELKVIKRMNVQLAVQVLSHSVRVCHSLLSRDILLPPTFTELWLELCIPGHSCSYVALVVLSAVLQL